MADQRTRWKFFDASFFGHGSVFKVMGALSNDLRKLAYFAGFYKALQSAGAAVLFRVDALKSKLLISLFPPSSHTTLVTHSIRELYSFPSSRRTNAWGRTINIDPSASSFCLLSSGSDPPLVSFMNELIVFVQLSSAPSSLCLAHIVSSAQLTAHSPPLPPPLPPLFFILIYPRTYYPSISGRCHTSVLALAHVGAIWGFDHLSDPSIKTEPGFSAPQVLSSWFPCCGLASKTLRSRNPSRTMGTSSRKKSAPERIYDGL